MEELKFRFICLQGEAIFDVKIQPEDAADRMVFYFLASDETKEKLDFYNDGLMRVTLDPDRTPHLFVVPCHDPKLRRDITIEIHDLIRSFSNSSLQ